MKHKPFFMNRKAFRKIRKILDSQIVKKAD